MYIPKGSYKPPVYTLGFNFVDMETRENYRGFYIEDNLGKFYSGKAPEQDGRELEKVNIQIPSGLKSGLKGALVTLAAGLANKVISDLERQKGQTKRYFVQDRNSGKIAETDKSTYNQAKTDLPNQNFSEVTWILTGPADNQTFGTYTYEGAASKNQKAIQALESQMKGISNFVTDYAYLVEDLPGTSKQQVGTTTISVLNPNIELDNSRKANFDNKL